MGVGTKRWLDRNFRKVSDIPVCASCHAQVLGSMVPTVDSLSTTNWLDSGLNYCESIINHNACLGEIYIAIPRQLVDTKKTFGRLYLTVLDFSLLLSVTAEYGHEPSGEGWQWQLLPFSANWEEEPGAHSNSAMITTSGEGVCVCFLEASWWLLGVNNSIKAWSGVLIPLAR